jgi:hypothetical protein
VTNKHIFIFILVYCSYFVNFTRNNAEMHNCTRASDTVINQPNKECKYDLTKEQIELWYGLDIWIGVYGRIFICASGLLFNFIAVVIFFHKELPKSFFYRLLLSLVCVDILYLTFGIIESCIRFYPNIYSFFIFFFISRPIRDSLMCCAIYIVILLAYERFRAFDNLSGNRIQCPTLTSWKQVLKRVFIVVLLSFLFKLPIIGEFRMETIVQGKDTNTSLAKEITVYEEPWDEKCSNKSIIRLSSWRTNYFYVLLYRTIADILITGIIPVICLSYFNYKILKGKKSFIQRRSTIVRVPKENPNSRTNLSTNHEISQAITLFAIVILLVLCHLLRIIMRISEWANYSTEMEEMEKGCHKEPYWLTILTPFSECLVRLNSSINFFIYWIWNEQFRKIVRLYTCRVFSNRDVTEPEPHKQRISTELKCMK